MKLKNTAFHPANRSLIPEDIEALPRPSKRIMEVLLKGSPSAIDDSPKSWSLDSCLSPKHFLGNKSSPSDVASTEFDVTELEFPFDPQSKVTKTGKTKMLPSSVVFRSVGYKSVALPGFEDAGIQFDESRGIMDNDGLGRVTRLVSDSSAEGVAEQQVPGIYCAGWVKRGPTGVIASTMADAFSTADAIVDDWHSGRPFLNSERSGRLGGWEGVKAGPTSESDRAVTWDQWRRIDLAERKRGQGMGKEREKFTSTSDMLAVLG